jgi:hypothetical protein
VRQSFRPGKPSRQVEGRTRGQFVRALPIEPFPLAAGYSDCAHQLLPRARHNERRARVKTKGRQFLGQRAGARVRAGGPSFVARRAGATWSVTVGQRPAIGSRWVSGRCRFLPPRSYWLKANP